MLTLYDRNEIVRNAYKFAKATTGAHKIRTTEDLRLSYLAALKSYQPYLPINYGDDPFDISDQVTDELIRAYSRNSDKALDDMGQQEIIGDDQLPPQAKTQKLRACRDALRDLLKSNDDLEVIFPLVIHSIFTRECRNTTNGPRAYGGSSGGALGVIWIGTLTESVSHSDLIEMFLHELTHHLLFLDEMCWAHFDYSELLKPANWAHSAILRKHRPLDKVVHSIVVATEIINARRTFLKELKISGIVHPTSEILIRETVLACESVFALPRRNAVLKPRTLDFVEKCYSCCKAWRREMEPVLNS